MDVEMCKQLEYEWNGNYTFNTDWTVASANDMQFNHFTGLGNTWTLEWMPDHVKYTVSGPQQPYKEYTFTDATKIPPATGQMLSIIYIGQFRSTPPPGNAPYYEAEVVLSGYQITPYPPRLPGPIDNNYYAKYKK
jgi:hypothetical protein